MKTVEATTARKEILLRVEGYEDTLLAFDPTYPLGYEKITEGITLDNINSVAFYKAVIEDKQVGHDYEEAVRLWLDGKVMASKTVLEGIELAIGVLDDNARTMLRCIDYESLIKVGVAIADAYVEASAEAIERAFKK